MTPVMSPHRYAPRDWSEVVSLVYDYPLAWIVSKANQTLQSTPLPLRPRVDDAGRIVRLDGHFARANPQVQALVAGTQDPAALALFMGANGYVSPSWMSDRTQAPTWVYASAAFQVRLEIFDDPARIKASLEDLTRAHEGGRNKAWAMNEMGDRYARLARGVIGFEAEVLSVQAKFKLGQDEREDVFTDIVTGLAAEGRGALAATLRQPEP